MLRERGRELYAVLREVRPLVLNSARVVEASLRDDGVTVGMRAVVEILAEHGAATVPAIADRLDLARQGVQRHVNDLLKLGLVASGDNPAHRRSVLISLTARGTALFDRMRHDELRRLSEMAAECSAADIAAALKVLRALNRDVRRQAAGR